MPESLQFLKISDTAERILGLKSLILAGLYSLDTTVKNTSSPNIKYNTDYNREFYNVYQWF